MSKNEGVMPHIFELCDALGITNIAQNYAGHCCEMPVDESWWFAINCNRDEVKCSKGPAVPSMRIYVEYNGWPAGLLDFTGSGEFAMGTGANEATFIESLRSAAARLRGEGSK